MNGSPDNQTGFPENFKNAFDFFAQQCYSDSMGLRNAGSCNCPIHPYRCLFVDRHRNEFDIHEFFSDHAGCFLVLVLILILLGTIGPFLIK